MHERLNILEKDYDAVIAGLTTSWSSGRVEGTVNRIILWNQRSSLLASMSVGSPSRQAVFLSRHR